MSTFCQHLRCKLSCYQHFRVHQESEDLLMSDLEFALRQSVIADDESRVREHMRTYGLLRLSSNHLEHAVRRGSLRTLEMYVAEFDAQFDFTDPCEVCRFVEVAIENDQLAVLRWGMRLFVRTYPKGTDGTHYAAVLAARAGSTETLRWMLTGERSDVFKQAFPEFCLLEEAARCMQFGTLRFLLEMGSAGVRCRQSRENVICVIEDLYDQTDVESVLTSVKARFSHYEIAYETLDDVPKSKYK